MLLCQGKVRARNTRRTAGLETGATDRLRWSFSTHGTKGVFRSAGAVYDSPMLPRIRFASPFFSAATGLVVPCLAMTFAACLSAGAQTRESTPIVLNDLGRATVPLDGPWQFHTGDDPAWAAPDFDDSNWQPIQVGRPWEGQGHPGYTGFGWYRLHVVVPEGAQKDWTLALSLPYVQDACEVYWNGVLVGGVGRVPPQPDWYWNQVPAVIPLGSPRSGVLAIRAWKAPHVYLSGPDEGGLIQTPRVGSLESVRGLHDLSRYEFLRSRIFSSGEQLFSGAVGLFALLAWLRNRKRRMLMWLALAMVYPLSRFVLQNFLEIGSFRLYYGVIGEVVALNDIATWFLLLYLLGIDDNKRLVRLTRNLSICAVALVVVDSVMVCFDWTRLFPRVFLIVDVVSTAPFLLLQLYGVVIVFFAIRKRLDASRWLLAASTLLIDLFQAGGDMTGLGTRWTHWNLHRYFVGTIANVAGLAVTPDGVIGTLFLVSILYVAWRYTVEQSQRQSSLEQEFRSAQELQQVLIPEALPTLSGYAVTSAYRPAQEVGGDFFQLIPLPGNAAMVVIGDVSGKGLRAAMAVALLVGAIRSTVEVQGEPAAVLAALNRRLHGRLRGGFATCLVLRLEATGKCRMANAGHLPPFLNGREVDLPPALPLGLTEDAAFECMELQMAAGDRLTLYTDGVLEARNAAGELFGFDRTRDISREPAEKVALAAQEFGQEDDITVLTLKFAGSEGTLA